MKVFSEKRYELYFKPDVAKHTVEETTDNEPTFVVKATLQKSECFDYGNGTAVGLEYENLLPQFERIKGFDTRYDKRVTEDFDGWCRAYFEDYYGKNLEKVEDITETLHLKYFRIPKDDFKAKTEITYGEALHIMLGTWKDNKYTRAMLTIPNWIDCRWSYISVDDYTDPDHPMVLMAGLANMLPLGMEYEEE